MAIAFYAATFFIAAGLWSGMRLVPVRDDGARKPSVVRELAEGWRDVRSHTWLWAIVVQFCFVNAAFSGAFEALGPLVTEQRLGGAGPMGPGSGGGGGRAAIGSVAMIWLRARRPLLAGIIGVLFGIPLLVLLGAGAPVGLLCLGQAVVGRRPGPDGQWLSAPILYPPSRSCTAPVLS